jgi:hypothetical protein
MSDYVHPIFRPLLNAIAPRPKLPELPPPDYVAKDATGANPDIPYWNEDSMRSFAACAFNAPGDPA